MLNVLVIIQIPRVNIWQESSSVVVYTYINFLSGSAFNETAEKTSVNSAKIKLTDLGNGISIGRRLL